MSTRTLRVGEKGGDTDATISPASAAALVGAGLTFVGRCICHPTRHDADLTRAELAMLTTAGLGVFVFAYYRNSDYTPANGKADGERDVAAMRAAGMPAGSTLSIDVEADHLGPDVAGHIRAWLDVVRASEFILIPIVYDYWPASTAEKDATGATRWWRSGGVTPHGPSAGYAMVQGPQGLTAGVPLDPDTVLLDGVVTVATSVDATTATTLSTARLGIIEIASDVVGIDSGSQRARYEDDIMPSPPEPMASHRGYDEASGCALWWRYYIRKYCQLRGLPQPPRLAAPYRMSMAIVDVIEMGDAAGARVKPSATTRPNPGDLVYIGGSDGTYEHAFMPTADDECIEGGVIVHGHQGVSRDSIGWNVRGGALYVGKRRVNAWFDWDKIAAWLASAGHVARPPNTPWADPPRMPPF